MKDILQWQESGFLNEESPTGINSLAQWAYDKKLFYTENNTRLSVSTLIQEFGEVSREEKALKATRKRKKDSRL